MTILEECVPGNIRLVAGSEERQGRLEVCYHGRFYSVCNSKWTLENTKVVCTQLGYSDTGSILIHSSTSYISLLIVDIVVLNGGMFGEASMGQILPARYRCAGNETELFSCVTEEISDDTNCTHSMDVGIYCAALPQYNDIVLLEKMTMIQGQL